ncbi:MAG: hypothetical protein PHV34_18120 [Verrucomicrobiae bacterium]|nr:hypothetical protein [Verrucomicrobiae bacterium]
MIVEKQPSPVCVFCPNLCWLDSCGHYYAQARWQGKLIRESLKTGDRAVAERKLRDWLAEHWEADFFPGKSTKDSGSLMPSRRI